MSETAKNLKINRTTLLRLLHTLEVEGIVERRPNDAGFQVGLTFLELSARALFSQDLVQVAVPVLTRVAGALQLSAHLGVLDGTDVLYLVRRTPNTPLASNIRVGSRLPAHATTMGRMLLAFMTPVDIETLFSGKQLHRFSEHTPTTIAELRAKAEKDRRDGVAWSEAHFERGIGSQPCRCSISPACRSARSMCPVRSLHSRMNNDATGSAPNCARRDRNFPPSRLDRTRWRRTWYGDQASRRGW